MYECERKGTKETVVYMLDTRAHTHTTKHNTIQHTHTHTRVLLHARTSAYLGRRSRAVMG